METPTEVIEQLAAIVNGALPASENNKSFADSLLNGPYGWHNLGFLTQGQTAAALKMIKRIKNPPPVHKTSNLSKVYAFLMNARKHLKFPKIMLTMGTLPSGEYRYLKVYLSGPRSSQPDKVNLVTNDQYGDMQLWLGRVSADGDWQRRDIEPELHDRAEAVLTLLAVDPAKVASEHGHLTGNCCFCHKSLKDERSTEVGYGPQCAKKWGLPWGTK